MSYAKPLSPEQVQELDRKIQGAVIWLRAHGFETTDSGDGSKYERGDEDAQPYAHVFMRVRSDELIAECDRLKDVLTENCINVEGPNKVTIQGTYDPVNHIGVIALMEEDTNGYLSRLPRRFCHYCRKPWCVGAIDHRGFDPDFNGA